MFELDIEYFNEKYLATVKGSQRNVGILVSKEEQI